MGRDKRVDLYKLLFPAIQEEDQRTGLDSYTRFWNEDFNKWNEDTWNKVGQFPVIKNLMWAIETAEEDELKIIDGLRDLTDPTKCPESLLSEMAISLGHPLESGLSEEAKRQTILSLFDLYKSRGKAISWDVYYRMLGFKIKDTPLWKKKVLEDNYDYNVKRYITAQITDENVGAPGNQNYVGLLANAPIKATSIRVSVSGMVFRDEPLSDTPWRGIFLSQDGSTGAIDYRTGEYQLNLAAAATTDVLVGYEHITEEFPYHAARVNLEIYLVPNEAGEFDTPVGPELVAKLVSRLDEVRPIHVLVILVIIVYDVPEQLVDFVTDSPCCGPNQVADVRSDEYRFYGGDPAGTPIDHALIITKTEGANIEDDYNTEDVCNAMGRPDVLKIEFSNGDPTQYW